LKISNVIIRTNDSLTEKIRQIPEMDVKYPFVPADLNKTDAIKEALTTPELLSYISTEELRGRENLSFYYVEKDRRTAQPFAGFILTIIGVCIASRKIRGGSGLHLAIGILLSALYIMFLQLSTTFATKSTLNPLIAVWIPNIMFAVLAYILYRRQVK
jgi:lipopolysaccharide export system permease protein